MMKKVLFGVAMTLLAGASVATLQSCKDDVSDLKTQTAFDLEQLKNDLDKRASDLQRQITQNANDIKGLTLALEEYAKITYVNEKVADLLEKIKKNAQDIAGINGEIGNINGEIGNINGEIGNINGEIAGINSSIVKLDQAIKANGEEITKLQAADVEILAKITGALQDIEKLQAKEIEQDRQLLEQAGKLEDLSGKYNTLETNYNNLKTSYENLKTSYETLNTTVEKLDGRVATIEGQVTKLDTRLGAVEGKAEANRVAIETINGTLTTIQASLSNLGTKVDGMENDISGIKGDLSGLTTTVTDQGNRLTVVEGKITEYATKFNQIDNRFEGIDQRLDGMQGSINAINIDIDGMKKVINKINEDLANTNIRVSTLEDNVADLNKNVHALNDNVEELKQKVYFLRKDLDDLINNFDELKNNLTLLDQKIDGVIDDLHTLSTRIDNMVTSLLIQATDSPVFGNFSLPLGVKSSVLFNWYGYNGTSRLEEFPTDDATFDGLGNAVDPFVGMLQDRYAVPMGFMGDVNLGTVYLTINPIGHMFDSDNFSLETTAGRPIPSLKMDVKKSNQELTFGYSRDSQKITGNGFYAAEVSIASENTGDWSEDQAAIYKGVDAVKISIDDNLKTAVRDLLKDRSKRNAVDLLKAVYGQLNGKFPAYAVRYTWDGGKYSVFSNYDLAVATARPLSYDSYRTTSIDRKLPQIGHINNFIEELKKNGNLHFDFSGQKINLKPFSIQLGKINIKAPEKIEAGEIKVEFDEIYVYSTTEKDEDGKPLVIGQCKPEDIKLTQVNDIVNQINTNIIGSFNQMKTDIDGWTANAEAQIQKQVNDMLKNVETEVETMMTNISGQINTKIDNLIDDFAGKAEPWFQRLNRLADLYNRFADKVNNVLEDPNHYLQVAMFYNQVGSGIGMLSNSIASPTPFAGNGYIGLYASSYTGEIVAPAFKKFVACTNVYEKVVANGKTTYEKKDNLVYGVNQETKNFNEVVDGNIIRYAIPTSALKPGYIYELTYQGLDYQGYTSTQKFYITVNK